MGFELSTLALNSSSTESPYELTVLLRIPHLPLAVFSWVLQAVARRGGI